MAEQIGYQFTVDDRRLLESLNKFEHGLEDIRAEAKKLSVDTAKAFNQISRQMSEAESKSFGFKKLFAGLISVDLVQRGVQAVRQLGQAAIGGAANYEQLNVAFTTFLGSAENADKLLKQLTETAANTPFEQDEIFGAARQLLAFGIEQERVNDLILDLGNISSGVGQPLSRLTLIFGQIQAKGKLVGQELLQLREAGVNPIEELAQVTGFAAHEIEDLASKGKISADDVAAAFKLMTGEGGRFNNLMEKQADTFDGLTSNFRDQIAIILRDFGTELLPTLKEATSSMIDFLKSLNPEDIKRFAQSVLSIFQLLGSVLKQLPFLIAGYLAYQVAVNGAAIATRALTVAQKLFNTASKANPIGLFLGVVLALGPQLLTLARRLSGVTKTMEEMRATVKQMKIDFGDETRAVNENIRIMGDLGVTTKQRQAAFDELSSKYPDILAKYDREKISLRDLITLQDELTQSITDRIVAEAEAGVDKNLFDKLLDIQDSAPSIAGERLNGFVEDTKHAFRDAEGFKQQLQDKIRKDQAEKAKEDADEAKRLIRETAKVFEDVNAEVTVRGGRNFGTLQQAQTALNKEKEREVSLQSELSKLSSSELRILANSQETESKRRAIAQDILKAREQEARANAGNKKEIEAAAKALEDYLEALKKVARDIEKTKIDQITNPFEKLQAEQVFALEQTKTLFDDLRKEAKKVGKDTTELTDLEARAKNQINVDYYRKLDELRKENREKELSDFINAQSQLADLRNAQISSTTRSDGTNTRDELIQKKILEADLRDLQVLLNNPNLIGERLFEIQAAFLEKKQQLDDVNLKNREAVIDRAEQLALAEIDLIEKSSDNTITLEEHKEKKRLEVALFYANERLKLLDPNSPEAKALKASIAEIEFSLSNIGKGNLLDGLKKKLQDLFDIDADELAVAIDLVGQSLGSLQDIISSNTDFQLEQNEIILEGIRERISETEDALAKEQEDQERGYASNVAAKKAELIQLREQEKQHEAEQLRLKKAALKQQLVADTLSQISSAATTVLNVTKANSPLPAPIAIPLIAATLVSIFALVKRFKQESKSLALFTGGRIPKEGYTDINGGRGHRIEGTNMKVGAGEWVTNADASERHNDFLRDLNSGKYDHLNLNDTLEPFAKKHKYKTIGKEISDRINRKREKAIEKKSEYEHRLRKEVMRDVFSGEISRLIQYMENKPETIPWTEGQIGLIEKKKGKTTRRKFSS